MTLWNICVPKISFLFSSFFYSFWSVSEGLYGDSYPSSLSSFLSLSLSYLRSSLRSSVTSKSSCSSDLSDLIDFEFLNRAFASDFAISSLCFIFSLLISFLSYCSKINSFMVSSCEKVLARLWSLNILLFKCSNSFILAKMMLWIVLIGYSSSLVILFKNIS